MKFFTVAWWRGECEDVDPIAGYRAHLDSIRNQVPPDLLSLYDTFALHDASLVRLTIEPDETSAMLVVENYEGDGRFTLTYQQLERFQSIVHTPGLPGPCGYGDLGYDEVDLLDSGSLEHRILFSSGIELRFVFRGFILQQTKVGSR